MRVEYSWRTLRARSIRGRRHPHKRDRPARGRGTGGSGLSTAANHSGTRKTKGHDRRCLMYCSILVASGRSVLYTHDPTGAAYTLSRSENVSDSSQGATSLVEQSSRSGRSYTFHALHGASDTLSIRRSAPRSYQALPLDYILLEPIKDFNSPSATQRILRRIPQRFVHHRNQPTMIGSNSRPSNPHAPWTVNE